jgi:hypothetical protein
VPRVSRPELLYVLICCALVVIAALDGGAHVWPYIALTIALLPAGIFSLVLLGLAAGDLPVVLGGGLMAVGVVLIAALNIIMARSLRGWCRRRRAITA